MSRGSKYMAAPNKTNVVLSTVTSSGNTSTIGERVCDDLDYGNTMEKDIQEEFKRLYMQLEMLKQKNMKLGNPHLTYKLSAMTEAAMKEEPPDSTLNSPNMNGKRVVINLDDFKDSTSL